MYLKDPRENSIDIKDHVIWEEDNRKEDRYQWGAMILDLCDMSPSEYQKMVYTVKLQTTYTIKFINYDESVLQEKQLETGSAIVYTGDTPSRPISAGYTYEFSGWNPELKDTDRVGTSDKTYTAQYSSSARTYTINYYYSAKTAGDIVKVLSGTTTGTYQQALSASTIPVTPENFELTDESGTTAYTFSTWTKTSEDTGSTATVKWEAKFNKNIIVKEYVFTQNYQIGGSGETFFISSANTKVGTVLEYASGNSAYTFNFNGSKEIMPAEDYTATGVALSKYIYYGVLETPLAQNYDTYKELADGRINKMKNIILSGNTIEETITIGSNDIINVSLLQETSSGVYAKVVSMYNNEEVKNILEEAGYSTEMSAMTYGTSSFLQNNGAFDIVKLNAEAFKNAAYTYNTWVIPSSYSISKIIVNDEEAAPGTYYTKKENCIINGTNYNMYYFNVNPGLLDQCEGQTINTEFKITFNKE